MRGQISSLETTVTSKNVWGIKKVLGWKNYILCKNTFNLLLEVLEGNTRQVFALNCTS